MITLTHYLVASACLFTIGLIGIMTRRNVILILLCIELMFNAANLAFVAYARAWGASGVQGQVCVFFIIIVAAAEVTVGLAITILLARQVKTLNADDVDLMKW